MQPMASDVVWAAVIAGAAGLVSSGVTYLVTRSGHGVQRAAIDAENARLVEQREQQERRDSAAFQRETLIELQNALSTLVVAAVAIHFRADEIYRESGKWGYDRLGVQSRQVFESAGSVTAFGCGSRTRRFVVTWSTSSRCARVRSPVQRRIRTIGQLATQR